MRGYEDMAAPPRIAVVGSTGQVAHALRLRASIRQVPLVLGGRPGVDITVPASIDAFLEAQSPDVVVNAAAYTAVDRAESEPAAAFAVNAIGSGNIAAACAAHRLPLIHISTDYVFDGSASRPYAESDTVAPLGVYGRSKAEGEALVRAATARHAILRTSWVYGARGNNFLSTMLRLATERDEVRVVADQTGSPTLADDLADAILVVASKLAALPEADTIFGTYHLTGSGVTTWHGLASEIFAQAARLGMRTPRLTAITTADYPTPARRPAWSVLDNALIRSRLGITLSDWRDGVARAVAEIARTTTQSDQRQGAAS